MSADMPETGEGPTTDVLLANLDGSEFVARRTESLFAQTRLDRRVLARDDGSGDGAHAIPRRRSERHLDRGPI